MKLTRAQFRKRYKKPDALIEGMMLDWERHIQLGNKPEIMLSEIPHQYHEVTGSYGTHHVRVVTGYKVKMIVNSYDPIVIAAYSPLVGGFVASAAMEFYPATEGLYHTSSLAHVPPTPDPLDDNTTRRILMADCLSNLSSTLARGFELHKWQFKNPTDDMMLNLVSCIKQQPQEKRDRLMVLLDKYGAPEGPLGEALMHIDKFRSL
jgi:hypothetical protein